LPQGARIHGRAGKPTQEPDASAWRFTAKGSLAVAKDSNTEERIRYRAYEIWIAEGQPVGKDKEHWDRAERELTGDVPAPTEPIGEVKYAQDRLKDGGEGQAPREDR
jgi:hypothetical protein